MKQREQMIRQTTMILSYFNEELPLVCLPDGSRYIPVIALCEMLGLRADVHIPRWRHLMLWCNARKLPWRPPTGRTRTVWCLHVGALPLWCNSFNWSLVTPVRQAQLREATDSWLKTTEQAHQEMLAEYREMRCRLFEFLLAYTYADKMLPRPALYFSLLLDNGDARMQLEGLVARGRDLIQEATNHARKMLQAQDAMPIMDVVQLGKEGEIEDVGSEPLFPVVPREERAQFYEYLTLLSNWHQEFAAFLRGTDAH
jgi:hypothetical protein